MTKLKKYWALSIIILIAVIITDGERLWVEVGSNLP